MIITTKQMQSALNYFNDEYPMNLDDYNEVVNGNKTYTSIACELYFKGKCIIGWDCEDEHRDILFVYKPHLLGGHLQRGLKSSYLYIGIIGFNCMGFLINEKGHSDKSKDYIMEKLNLSDNNTTDELCNLIYGVVSELEDLMIY